MSDLQQQIRQTFSELTGAIFGRSVNPVLKSMPGSDDKVELNCAGLSVLQQGRFGNNDYPPDRFKVLHLLLSERGIVANLQSVEMERKGYSGLDMIKELEKAEKSGRGSLSPEDLGFFSIQVGDAEFMYVKSAYVDFDGDKFPRSRLEVTLPCQQATLDGLKDALFAVKEKNIFHALSHAFKDAAHIAGDHFPKLVRDALRNAGLGQYTKEIVKQLQIK